MPGASGFDSRSFDRSLLALGRSAELRAREATGQSNRLLAARVREECPVDSGRLRASIRIEPMRGGPSGVSQEVTVGRTDPRRIVRYVHDGTSRRRANPFFGRAIEATEAARQGIIGRAMARVGRSRAT